MTDLPFSVRSRRIGLHIVVAGVSSTVLLSISSMQQYEFRNGGGGNTENKSCILCVDFSA